MMRRCYLGRECFGGSCFQSRWLAASMSSCGLLARGTISLSARVVIRFKADWNSFILIFLVRVVPHT